MTTIANYAELKTNLLDFSKRDDALGKLDIFIDLAEADIWEHLRIRDMEARATASTSTVSRFLALPDGFLKMRKLTIELDNSLQDLEFIDPVNLKLLDVAGFPYHYTITSEIEFNRISDQAYDIEMQYFRSLTPLSSANTTNAVLTNHPLIYLSCCLMHLFRWALDVEMSNYWAGIFTREIAQANNQARKGRYGPAPSITVNGMVV